MSAPDKILFYEALDLSQRGIVITNQQGKIIFWNKWLQRRSHFSAEQAIGHTLTELFPDIKGRHLEKCINSTLSIGISHTVSHSLHKTGLDLYPPGKVKQEDTKLSQSFFVSSIHSHTTRHCLIQIDDVTVAEKREQALTKLATKAQSISTLKSEFISTVSHELRTPLTSIRGAVAILASNLYDDIRPAGKKLVNIALNNTERLLHLINDILDIEKIEAGRIDFDMQTGKLLPLLQKAIENNQPYAQQHQVQYVLYSDAQADDLLIYADQNRMIQVFNNLLSNAAKFSRTETEVSIRVETSGDTIRINFTDQGQGIPEAFQEHIFEKFSQADASTTREVNGTGLGLSICREIMHKLNGIIDYTTQEGVGTTFFIELPAHKEDSQTTQQQH